MHSFTVKRTDSGDPDFKKLIHLLDNDLRQSNGEATQAFFKQFNIIVDVDTVVLVYCDALAVGCGCFKKFNEHSVEVKRMFVTPDKRGLGIAAMILGELETWAREQQNTYIVLETGTRLKPAINLYTKHGFTRIDNWGQYIGVAESVCMGKPL